MKHGAAEPFKELERNFKRENLFANPLEAKFVKPVAAEAVATLYDFSA